MKKIRLVLILMLPLLFMDVSAETRLNLRGGLSLTNNDISRITAESVQDEENYSGFFIGPALTVEAEHLLGFDVGLLYQKTSFKVADETYSQEFLEIPLSLRLKFGLKNLSIIGQFGPQWNINIGDIQSYVEDNEEIDADKIITTGNIGAGVRLFDSLELMLNFNVPWKIIADNTDDFQKMSDLIGDYKTVQFVIGWRF
jgi:hypothetical protein